MAKQGMKRPETDFAKPPKNDVKPVPQIQGRAKFAKKRSEERGQARKG